MKIKTAELLGPALDWAVAKLEEEHDKRLTVIRREDHIGHPIERETESGSYAYEWWAPSRIWAQGGPIIEREGIELKRSLVAPFVWAAFAFRSPRAHCTGPAPLIAAMRCFVASKLGDEVEIPEELL